jgi:hypothetical protein
VFGAMPLAFSIDRDDGAMLVGDHRLSAGQSRRDVERLLAAQVKGGRDFGNGYAWLDLEGLSFGGQPAWLSLCFHHGRLSEASWSVALPGAPEGWPTREAIDEEVEFVRAVLAQEIGFAPSGDSMTFPWGEVWSLFDPKGDLAANGLRYGRR